MPLVSVILTSYNHEKFIAQSIESVLKQTFTDYELIIIDDCSTDNSWDIIRSFSDPRILHIRNETNRRFSIPNNLHRCRGKYIAIHHSDDLWKPEKLEKQVRLLESSDYAAVFTLVDPINEEGLPYTESDAYKSIFVQPNRTRHEWLRFFFSNGNALCHPSVLIRKEVYFEADLISYNFTALPDFYKWVKVCLLYDIYIIQEPLTCFRVLDHGKNTSGDRPDNIIRGSIEMYWIVKEFLKLNNQDEFLKIFPEAEKLLVNGEIVIAFAFARLIIDSINYKPYIFAAYQILFDLMNDAKLAYKVKKLYSYTRLSFSEDIAKYDIFSVIDESKYLESKVYLWNTHNPEDGCSWEKKVYLQNTGQFVLDMDIQVEAATTVALRFIPDVRISRGYSIEKVLLDGKETGFRPIDGDRMGEFDIFSQSLAEYEILVNDIDVSKITVYGKADHCGITALRYALESAQNELLELRKINKDLYALLDKSNLTIQKLISNKK